MNGGYNPIKDLYKMEVFRISALRNGWKPEGAKAPDGEVIPQNILVKPPTAELRENQKDQDSLPPYPILDEVLTGMIEDEISIAEIVARGEGRFERDLVKRVERLVLLAEYKRRQSAPGVKLTKKAFGIGRTDGTGQDVGRGQRNALPRPGGFVFPHLVEAGDRQGVAVCRVGADGLLDGAGPDGLLETLSDVLGRGLGHGAAGHERSEDDEQRQREPVSQSCGDHRSCPDTGVI